MTALPQSTVDQVLALHVQGSPSLATIAKATGITHRSTVRRILLRAGLSTSSGRVNPGKRKYDWEAMRHDWHNGMSHADIAKKHGCSDATARRVVGRVRCFDLELIALDRMCGMPRHKILKKRRCSLGTYYAAMEAGGVHPHAIQCAENINPSLKRLVFALNDRGFTLKGVVARIGHPLSVVHKWFMGKTSPSLEAFENLAELAKKQIRLDDVSEWQGEQAMTDFEKELMSLHYDGALPVRTMQRHLQISDSRYRRFLKRHGIPSRGEDGF